MQKKDLQSHMIKLHGAPKPHAVRGAGGSGVLRGNYPALRPGLENGTHCPVLLCLVRRGVTELLETVFLGTGAALVIFLADRPKY